MAVSSPRGRGQPGDIAGSHLAHDPLERHRRDVVALIDDHVAIGRHDVVHHVLADEALDHGNIQPPVRFPLAGTDLADLLGFQVEEER